MLCSDVLADNLVRSAPLATVYNNNAMYKSRRNAILLLLLLSYDNNMCRASFSRGYNFTVDTRVLDTKPLLYNAIIMLYYYAVIRTEVYNTYITFCATCS